ncbi:unnamed protein product [Rotaria socialis]|uniref:Elongation of very long chain fatty acids protein n=1 Tax=Rotaria socialis TaxID=392032 RepID=A0A817PGB0_9BILA|nr:unnamed protein product [Rotaria socialis]CAF3342783.1 unnamed protein product [Rotaria socialis]CAF3492283.1 unnamed protein product [Rotaria socialis]CAF3751748.1 unnamed protein product [Rotaria socialis]
METINFYNGLWQEIKQKYSDPRTSDLFMMNSPIPSALICIGYLIAVCLGPKFMANRSPYNIRQLLLVYNVTMVVLSGYLFYEFLAAGWLNGYSLGCQPVDYSRSATAMRMVRVCYLFFLSKFIELFDTIFFIMKKNFHQVSVLHVLHHGIMPISWWFGIRFVPGGFGTFHSCINSFIHFLMYLYYGLAALSPSFRQYLFLKKSMTWMQMIQFMLVMVHTSQLFFLECDYPILFAYWIFAYAIMFLLFFANFYVQVYKNKSSSGKSKSQPIKSKINGYKKEE